MLETNTRVLGVMKGDFQGTDGYLPRDQIPRMKERSQHQDLEAEIIRIFYFTINGRRRSTT